MTSIQKGYMVLPQMRVQNFNTISSPLTWGAPSITAAIGFMQALQRKLPLCWGLSLNSVGMVIHDFEPQVNGEWIKKFNLTRNPTGKNGETLSITEEGRAHATISLVFSVTIDGDDLSEEPLDEWANEAFKIASSMRFAGGSILHSPNQKIHRPQLLVESAKGDAAKKLADLKRSLLPGFALISREDLLIAHTNNLKTKDENATTLDAWLDLSRNNRYCVITEKEDENGEAQEIVSWEYDREVGSGWLVPIPVGYSALSELYDPGVVQNTRNPNGRFRFVEAMYSIGEWRSPHRLDSLDELLWYSQADNENGLYQCINYKQKQL